EILQATAFPADHLILEITESVIMADGVVVRERLCELKGLGVRIAIDDFGTGYSNLAYLQRFPVDILKIDRTFVTEMAKNQADAALASSIVGLATSLNLHTVAEGIEETGQREQLLALGCAYGQGYLFAKPITPEAITQMLNGGIRTNRLASAVA